MLISGTGRSRIRLTILATALAGSLFTTKAYSTTSEDYEKALTAFNASKYDETYIHLKNSLQKDPENLASKILMGKILLINGYLNAAEIEFVEALEMGADINLLAESLGNTWLFLNKYTEIVDFTQTNKLTNAPKREWLQIRATACIRLDDLICAKADYDQILLSSPNYVPAINGLASIALQQADLMTARKLIRQSEGLETDNAITWRLKGQLAYREGDTKKATEYLQTALSYNREDPIALRNLVDLYLQAKDYDQAKLFVDEIIEDTPNDPLAILLNSWLQSRDTDTAIDNEQLLQLNEFMSQLDPEIIGSQPMLLYISGLTNFFNNNMEKAAQDFIGYLQNEPDDIQAVMMLTQVYMATQQSKQALMLLERYQQALMENPDSAIILGNLFIKQNKAFKAERLLNELEKRYPNEGKLQLFKIKLMAARGKQAEALSILEKNFAKYKDSPSFLFTYALMNLQATNYEDALRAASSLADKFPDDAEVYNLQAGILIRQGKLNEAKAEIEKALEISPALFPAKFNLAATESRLGNIDASSLLVDELLILSPAHNETLLLKAYNLTRQGLAEQAKQIYIDILTLTPSNAAARERLVALYQSEGDTKNALYHLDRLIKDDFDNPDYLLNKAGLLIALNDIENAKKTLNIVESFIKQDAPKLLRLSALLMQLNEETKALGAMEKAQAAAPSSSFILLAHARLLLQLDKVSEAKKLLSSVKGKDSDNANYWLLKGDIFAAEGNDDEALQAYQHSLKLDSRFAPPLIAIYNYALEERYVDTFIEQSESLIKNNPDNLLAKNLLAQYLFFIRDFSQSMKLYEEIIDEPNIPSPAQAYNRLAIMSMEMDTGNAERYIAKAFELDSSSPKILDTYGWLKAQQTQYETSLKLLRDAFARDANDPNIRYHLGYTLAKLGRVEEAKEELTFAVNVNRPFFKRPEAQSLLDSL
ncbi:PEP-CTERM system TPR-repeat protein PrsT [Alteromonas sp. 1_MG-2023]|uniref:XrtA/PEP-CTERM system TPR-repeat protein PrsT n=1 Tax=Alteromonas sp. 1_MG-2023 TaxID=3062669 RepID=UPI0026E3F709|nr:XrtA/PEP-CTERM system TPR-repeat protein PrsT [Alteromonas sp. 1_MG-2023]MDO6566146.1 PEP-CTERM system TPR-repeat protein PrsT [Alteromonas sp. 1_MG-2023]